MASSAIGHGIRTALVPARRPPPARADVPRQRRGDEAAGAGPRHGAADPAALQPLRRRRLLLPARRPLRAVRGAGAGAREEGVRGAVLAVLALGGWNGCECRRLARDAPVLWLAAGSRTHHPRPAPLCASHRRCTWSRATATAPRSCSGARRAATRPTCCPATSSSSWSRRAGRRACAALLPPPLPCCACSACRAVRGVQAGNQPLLSPPRRPCKPAPLPPAPPFSAWTAEGARRLQAHRHRPVLREVGGRGLGAVSAAGSRCPQQAVGCCWVPVPSCRRCHARHTPRPRLPCTSAPLSPAPDVAQPPNRPPPQVGLVDALTGAHFHLPHLDERVLEVAATGVIKPDSWACIKVGAGARAVGACGAGGAASCAAGAGPAAPHAAAPGACPAA